MEALEASGSQLANAAKLSPWLQPRASTVRPPGAAPPDRPPSFLPPDRPIGGVGGREEERGGSLARFLPSAAASACCAVACVSGLEEENRGRGERELIKKKKH